MMALLKCGILQGITESRYISSFFVPRPPAPKPALEREASKGSVCPVRHFGEAESDPEMGAFTEHNDRVRELCDNKGDYARKSAEVFATAKTERCFLRSDDKLHSRTVFGMI